MFTVDEENNISLTRGDTLKSQIALMRNELPYYMQSGDIIHFYLKHNLLNAYKTKFVETEPLITKTINSQTMLLELEPIDTADLPFGDYVYDLELTYANGDIDTFINCAKFTILPEVGSITEDEGE